MRHTRKIPLVPIVFIIAFIVMIGVLIGASTIEITWGQMTSLDQIHPAQGGNYPQSPATSGQELNEEQLEALSGRLEMFGIFISIPQLVAAVGAVLTTGFVYRFVTRTETGRALQATAEDKEAAALMGINSDRMFSLAWGIGAACVGDGGGPSGSISISSSPRWAISSA
jgi:branched-subunit amino acid ABC-type transport system permease component